MPGTYVAFATPRFVEGDKGVVALTRRVDHLDAVGDAFLDALAGDAFQHDHDGGLSLDAAVAARTRATSSSAAGAGLGGCGRPLAADPFRPTSTPV